MQTKTITLTAEQNIVVGDLYTALIANDRHQYHPIEIGEATLQFIEKEIVQLIDNGGENHAVSLGHGDVAFLKGGYGVIALYRPRYRAKATIMAPITFWESLPKHLSDVELFKRLVKSRYIDASRSVTTFNLENPHFKMMSNWG